MKRMLPAAILAACVSTAVTTASGEVPGPCCACLPGINAETSTNGRESAMDAVFCSLGMTAQAEIRCGAQMPPGMLLCVAAAPDANTQGQPGPGSSCSEQLAAEGIICPAAGVPTAAPFGLGLLVLVLTGLGTALLRRRSNRPRA